MNLKETQLLQAELSLSKITFLSETGNSMHTKKSGPIYAMEPPFLNLNLAKR